MSTRLLSERLDFTFDSAEYWDVEAAASCLTKQACTLGHRHIKDQSLRLQFNREIAYFSKKTVDQVAAGEKSVDEGLQDILRESRELTQQSSDMVVNGAGLVAGLMQIKTGLSVCKSAPSCLVFGAPLIAHGGNNIYEGFENIRTGRSDAKGWVRRGYQAVAEQMGYSEKEGNLTYGTVDLSLSGYGFVRNVLKPGAWKLFRYIRSDFEKAYKSVGNFTMAFESYVSFQTGRQMYNEVADD